MAFINCSFVKISKIQKDACPKSLPFKNYILRKNDNTLKLRCKPENVDKNDLEKEKNEDNDENILNFFKEITNEMKMIEWPSLDRLFKQFVIVVISLVFTFVFIYSVDGIFASLSKYLFEGN